MQNGLTSEERHRRALEFLGLPPDGGRPTVHKSKCARSVSSVKCKERDFGRHCKTSRKWRFASCESKKRYRTQDEARRTARNCKKHRGVELHAYFCPICKGYHLTRANWNERGEKVW